ncbi:hypothetical protein MKW92_001173 [Papaver armeniacum]|nr:hypothetical protein MKW92_001173 [Papaver armeniacum]
MAEVTKENLKLAQQYALPGNEEKPEVEESNLSSEEQEESSEEEVAADETSQIKVSANRFSLPTTNQSRHCFTRYIEHHRCVATKGEVLLSVKNSAKYYRSLCPGEWENGTFPGPL